MSGFITRPGIEDHSKLLNLDYAHAAHTGFQGIEHIPAPFTWTDLSDPAYWIPAPPFAELGTLAITPAGAVLTGNNAYTGNSTGMRFGVASRGRFFPDSNGNLEFKVNVDQYVPGDDVAIYYRFLFLLMNIAMTNAGSEYAAGLMYGAKPAAGKEAFDLITEAVGFPYSAPSVRKAISGNQNQLADNSSFYVRIKEKWWYNVGAPIAFYYTYHAYFNANGGATIYGGDLADADKHASFQSFGYDGCRLLIGAYAASISARFKVRIISVTLEAGLYIPI